MREAGENASRDLIRVEDLRVWLPVGRKRFVRAVDGVSFSVARSEIVALVGESGSGKSTTGRAMLRLVRPTSGHVYFDASDITAFSQARLRPLRRRLQMIFQHPAPALNPRIRVGRSIAEPLDALGVARSEANALVDAMLERVGLPTSAAQQFPHELSGGQLQRVAIARALVVRPDFVVADEPLSSLDLSVQAQVVALLKELQREMHVSLLFITHDLAIAEYLSDRVVVMYLGKVMEIAPARRFTSAARHPYSRALLDAVPRLDPLVERERAGVALSGEIPSALEPPLGCRFHTRCPLAEERCRIEEPPLRRIADEHVAACWLV
jgi:oligopeptide/dipeptide ABC transporter ATP-binding protein